MLTRNKKIVALSISILALATCSVPATGDVTHIKQTPIIENQVDSLMSHVIKTKELYDAQLELEQIRVKTNLHNERMDKIIRRLEGYVGKTWYVFSGSTPKGWDCSGLTKWFYRHFDVELEHRASKQANAGEKISSPLRGDLVVFKYKNSRRVYHVGVYTGQDLMIHAPREGQKTREESISDFAGNHSIIEYVRIVKID